MEKLKVLLLVGILGVLLFIAFRPQQQIGRFVEVDAGSNIALDTATGQWCYAAASSSDHTFPLCREIH